VAPLVIVSAGSIAYRTAPRLALLNEGAVEAGVAAHVPRTPISTRSARGRSSPFSARVMICSVS